MNTEEKLEELLLDWEEHREAGRHVSADELCRTCPELAPILNERIKSLLSLDWVRGAPKGQLEVGAEPAPGYAEPAKGPCPGRWRGRLALADQSRERPTSLVSRYSSRPWTPPSRPRPLYLMPPNGAAAAVGLMSLMPTMPNWRASLIRVALAMLVV